VKQIHIFHVHDRQRVIVPVVPHSAHDLSCARFSLKVRKINYVFWFQYKTLSASFIVGRMERDIIIKVQTSSFYIPVILIKFQIKLNLLNRFLKNTRVLNS
jgi:hypothetical protein